MFETILVIALLGLTAAGLLTLQPRIFKAQGASRDEHVAHELQRACAERVLTVRRTLGYTSVTTTSCTALGTVDGYTPTVALSIAGAASSPCGGTSCVASITVNKSGVASTLPAITVELSQY